MSDYKIVSIEDVCTITKGSTGIQKAIDGDFPMVTLAEKRRTHNEFQFNCEAVLIPLVSSTGHGHASMKRVHYQEGKFALGSILCAVIPKDTNYLNAKYLHIYLSYLKEKLLVPLMRGAANVSLSISNIKTVEVVIPSIERQLEIIELEQVLRVQKQKLDQENIFQQSHLKNLRQQILQDAISGKLTTDWRAENPDIEPASELLKQIKTEKEKLIAEKKIKKGKPLAPISVEEIPFDLPEGWVWCRLGEIIIMNYGSGLTKHQRKSDGEYPVFGSNGIVGHHDEFLTEHRAIIIGRKGSAGAINTSDTPSWTTDVAYFVEETQNLDFKYLYYLLKSLGLDSLGKGIKPGLNRNEAYALPIPLPPRAEQKAIVIKIEKLMEYVGQLEKLAEKNKENTDTLMQAFLGEVFRKK